MVFIAPLGYFQEHGIDVEIHRHLKSLYCMSYFKKDPFAAGLVLFNCFISVIP